MNTSTQIHNVSAIRVERRLIPSGHPGSFPVIKVFAHDDRGNVHEMTLFVNDECDISVADNVMPQEVAA